MRKKKNFEKLLIGVTAVLVIVIVGGVTLYMQGREHAQSDSEQNFKTTLENTIPKQEEVKEQLEVVQEEPAQSVQTITSKKEASYEHWLAAGMIIGISLQYPEYEFIGMYTASETEISNSLNSKGVYVIFMSEGNEIAIYSKPIDKERTEVGTRDLYTKDLGYATFDEISLRNVSTDGLQKIEINGLSELIEQSVLVSIYEH